MMKNNKKTLVLSHSKKTFLVLLILLYPLFLSGFSSALDTSFLEAYYSLDEGTSNVSSDLSGNGYDGTLYNGNSSNWVSGIIGYGLYFDGTNDYFNTSFSRNYLPNDNFSINYWFKTDNLVASAKEHFGIQNVTDNSYLGVDYTGSVYSYKLKGGTDSPITAPSTTPLGTDEWEMHTLVRDGVNKRLLVYINGTLEANVSDTTADSVIALGVHHTFGARNRDTTPTAYTNGTVDEISFWNKTLNSTEISDLYNNDQGNLIFSEDYDFVSYQTKTDTYYANVSVLSGQTPSNALFFYDGSSYTASITSTGNNNYNLSYSLTHQGTDTGVKQFYFTYDVNTSTLNSTVLLQIINPLTLSYCSSGSPYLNITFQDEETLSSLNATIPSSTFDYYVGDGSVKKTLTYSNDTLNYAYAFCSNEPSLDLYIDPLLQYEQDSSYPQRVWNPSVSLYTSTVTNQVLYLLNESNAQTVSFQVVDSANNLISGVGITLERLISGSYSLIGSGTTDGSGLVSFLLDPDYQYRINATKTGYPSSSTILFPTQTTYTITLGVSTSNQLVSYQEGVTLRLSPTLGTQLYNDTTYTFSLTANTTEYDFSSFGFLLLDSNGTVRALANSTSTTGGVVSTNFNTANYEFLRIQYFYVINGTTITAYGQYNVFNTQYNTWSVANFFTDFNNYLDEGIFGLDSFGKSLIIYLILFMSIGIMSYKYGVSNPVVISLMTFGIVYFFDVSVGLLPNPISAIDNFFTWLSALVATVVIAKEVIVR